MTNYDVAIIGGGPGGYTLALDCARRKMKVALINLTEHLGGTCLNIGCIPSKALLESSELYHRIIHESAQHGITLNTDDKTNPSVNLKKMMTRKEDIIKRLAQGIAGLMKSRKVELFHGYGRFVAPGVVEVENQEKKVQKLHAKHVVLATGSVPIELPQIPFDGKRVIDSTQALSLSKVPRSMAIIGGGAIGLELGSVWSRLGTQVTIIEAQERIVPGSDAQASQALARMLKQQGLIIRTGTVLNDAKVGSRKVDLSLKSSADNKNDTLSVETVLVAVGRRANIDSGIGLDIKPEKTANGHFLHVDANFATSVSGLYAIGDVIGNPMLAHKAEEEGLALAALLAGEAHPPWGGPIPGIVYTEPELAWAGETEESLQNKGIAYEKGQFPFAANSRAIASGRIDGFVKLLSSPGDGKLLGAVMLGSGASELIAEAVSVMGMGGSAEDIALTVHGHPTLSETTKEAALSLLGRPLHRT